MNFEFATANRIIFGEGSLQQVGSLAREMGNRALVVTGGTVERANPLLELLQEAGVETATFSVAHEPTIEIAQHGTQRARDEKCNLVVGFGGGSAVDAGKAISALLTNEGEPLDYLEVIGQGKKLQNKPAPYIAIPTTAGTGSEVTKNAVLASPEERVKVSLRSNAMLPRLALVDPELTYSLPPAVTASTGLDALIQLLEAYVSHQANPLTDGLCREGLQRAGRSLRRAYENGEDKAARRDMAIASLFGGLALANAKLGAVHGFAGPFGGMFPEGPHGAVCAALLPPVMAINLQALQERVPDSEALQRYHQVAQILTGSDQATAVDGVAWVEELSQTLQVPPLAEYGLARRAFPALIEKAQQSSSMKGNPIQLTEEELAEILSRAL